MSGVSGQIPPLVEDEDVAGVIGLEHPGPAIQPRGAEHAGEQRLHRGEAHGVPALEQREADGDAEVSLAQARRADQDEGPSLRDEPFVEIA
jgi:hypothetical protein